MRRVEVRARHRALIAAALVIGEISCDGDRGRVEQPRDPSSTAGAAGDHVTEPAPSAAFLDAPAGTLDRLFAGFAAAERGDPNGRALLVFFGDSHTAGDAMTSRLRVTLQTKFGDAGRGLVAAGKPRARHYYQRDVRYGASGQWRSAIGGSRTDREPFGLVGIRVWGQQKGAQLWVATCDDCSAGARTGQFEVLYQAGPDHGLLRYRVDDQPWQQLDTKTAEIEPPHPGRHVIPVADGSHKLTLEHGGNGMLELYGVVLERLRPGVIVDSLGIVGRRLVQLRSWDWSIIGEQLATRDPRLVVLQYGTNEADDRLLDLQELARSLDDTILRIRAAAPAASILILGPPDMGVRAAGKACDRRKPPAKPSNAAVDAPAAVDAGVAPECTWRTPAVLEQIIAVQRAAAVRNRVAFFDTFAALGGPDRMDGWVNADPRLAFKDHVHFTGAGYRMWADALSSALLDGYDQWRRAHNVTQSPAGEPPRNAAASR
ncbi:MAG: GDSL-type esterase/lipase family protein [Kofleriaceae bacterium]